MNTMAHNIQCPLCSGTSTQGLISYDNFPYFTTPLAQSRKKEILQRYSQDQLTEPLKVRACRRCCHCYVEHVPDNAILDFIYSNYSSYPSPLKGHFKPERDNAFLQFFVDKVEHLCKENGLRSVLEIGCYDGYILYHLQQRGFQVTGCDPSEGAEIGKEYGIDILRKFFNADDFLEEKRTYDIVISRHFIEHLATPKQWIESLQKILNPKGFVILETPNVQFYLEKGLLEVFSLQHLQAFSSVSLEYTLAQSGMNVIAMEKTPDNLITIARRGAPRSRSTTTEWDRIIENFHDKLTQKKKEVHTITSSFIHQNKRIAMWGAGGFGLVALLYYGVPSRSIEYIIDSDSKKWCMEYLHNSIPIISPEEALQRSPDLIIIASMYSKSIQQQIHDIGFHSSVATLFPMCTRDTDPYEAFTVTHI